MARYLLLLHENPSQYAAMTPAQMGEIIERYTAWSAGLAAAGRLVGGEKLKDAGGRRLQRSGSQVVAADGPYIEAKDVIGGLFIIDAASMQEAESLIQDCPHLSGDNWIELREIEALG
jgi:hypothetical protein